MTATVSSSSLSMLSWVDVAGDPQAGGVITLIRGQTPTLAFTYADDALAREVARSPEVALALVEERSTGRAFAPLLLRGRPTLVEDPSGEVFAAELLEQELLRYPPARVYADSPLLRRENWWYLPRLLVGIDVDSAQPLTRRSDGDLLLVVADGHRPAVAVAGVVSDDGVTLILRVEGPAVPVGSALLFGQDASFPDLERWSQWRYRGHWDGTRFTVQERPARTGLQPTLSLLQRWRRQRHFEKRCRAAIPG